MIEGSFFDTRRSRMRRARAEILAPGRVRVLLDEVDADLEVDGQARAWERPLSEVEISERLGDIPRRLILIGVGVFETHDNDAVDRALAELGRRPGLVHWLEQRWPIAIASLVAVVIGSLLFVRFGLPATAAFVARILPTSVDQMLGAQTLDALDRLFFEASALPDERQVELQRQFASMTRDLDEGHDYQLRLRAAPSLGPNALALPSGIVVMTDELVLLAEHDEELVAVLAHELGHVRGRHALRQILQSTGVSALALVLLGDVTSASTLLSAAPALIEAKHSRDFEREADGFAKSWLEERGIAPERFDAILCRMGGRMGGRMNSERNDRMQDEAGDDAGSTFGRYLSTHPPTDERVRCDVAR